MTTIKFHRSGGIVGNVIHLDLNLNDLPDNEAQHLIRLVTEADFFNLPENLSVQATTDEFQYSITVEAGRARHTVHVSDTTMPKDLLPLVKELTLIRVLQ